MQTKQLLEPGQVVDGTPTVPGMLRMRAVSMAWSGQMELPSMIGVDGSLLVLANRAGGLDFWRWVMREGEADDSYTPPGFSRVAQVTLPGTAIWASQLSWSEWTSVDATSGA